MRLPLHHAPWLTSQLGETSCIAEVPVDVLKLLWNHLALDVREYLARRRAAVILFIPEAPRIAEMPLQHRWGQIIFDGASRRSESDLGFWRKLRYGSAPTHFFCQDCFTLKPRECKDLSKYGRLSKIAQGRLAKSRNENQAKLTSCCGDVKAQFRILSPATGIVDLCPCVILTETGKRRIEDTLSRVDSSGGSPDFPWHTCIRQYPRQVQVETKILMCLLNGSLMAKIEYRRSGPFDADHPISRKYCPHGYLDAPISILSECHENHDPHSACAIYQRLRFCAICETKLTDTFIDEAFSPGAAYITRVERSLSDKDWYQQTVYLPQPPHSSSCPS